MRITSNTIVADFLANLQKSQERINRLNKQLSSGTKLLRVSDDPITANTLLRLQADLSRVETYRANVVDGTSLLKMTADSLDQIGETLDGVKSALGGATIADAALLNQLGDQMDSYLSLVLDVANTQFDNKYIFAGTATGAIPYVRSGSPEQVNYVGNAQPIRYQVGDNVTSIVNITGAAAFNSTGEISLGGTLDNAAAVNTVVTNSMTMTDANGVSHVVDLTFRKTDANTWEVSAAMPAGATDATLGGGTATLTFDPATGALTQIVRGAPLVLTPAATTPGTAAPAMTMMFTAGTLAEGGASAVSATQNAVSLFNKLIELRDKLKSGIQPTSDDIAMIGLMQNVVQREQAKAGSLTTNLTTADAYLVATREHLLDLQSAKQDVDLAEIGMRLKQEEVMLEAALSAAAKIIPKSLMDYL